MPQTFIQEPTTPKRKAFIEAYQKAYNDRPHASPVSAAQGYDSRLSAGRRDHARPAAPMARKIREALENLKTKVDGVVTTYDHPYTADDHEAITAEYSGDRRSEGRPRGAGASRGSRRRQGAARQAEAMLRPDERRCRSARGVGAASRDCPGERSRWSPAMEILAQLVVSGIALGMIYAVIAFGYQLTFATSKTLNFGQGEALMLGALVGLTLGRSRAPCNYWLMLPLVLVFGALQGAVVERIGVRRRSRPSPSSAGSCRRSRWASSSRMSPRTSGAATT